MSADNLTEEEELWWERAANAIAGILPNTYRSDWMADGNCLADSKDDLAFLYKPDAVTEKRWEFICRTCPVAIQCMEWGDEVRPSGVYLAGEWRE